MSLDSFDELSYGDEIRYVGPESVPGSAVTPTDWKQPYEFRYVSMGGTLACHDRFNGNKYLASDHPCNDASYWEVAE